MKYISYFCINSDFQIRMASQRGITVARYVFRCFIKLTFRTISTTWKFLGPLLPGDANMYAESSKLYVTLLCTNLSYRSLSSFPTFNILALIVFPSQHEKLPNQLRLTRFSFHFK